MPWNEADRVKYAVIRGRYSTDMSDAEFELISPLLPAPKKRGRKPTGLDAGKKIKGRKRHLAVDTLGLPIECQLTAASVQDRDALAPLLGAVHRKSPWVRMSFVDGGYQGEEAQRAAFEASRIAITVVKRTDKQVTGFVVLPKRWVVERTLGWINRARRLSKDFEATIESSLAWLQLALAFLLMRRLARAKITLALISSRAPSWL
jgi:transposase